MPLDYPGKTVVNPRRNPPVLMPTERNGMPNMTYPLGRDDPKLLDVICDDQVLLTLQYSTQWDSLAHVGQLFDADGDGMPEIVFYNGYRAGEHIAGPVDYRDGQAVERAGGHLGATGAVDRQHGGARHAGTRRDDRSRSAFRPRRENGLL